MGYFGLMAKRILRLCPAVLGITLLMLAAVLGIAAGLLGDSVNDQAQQMKIGMVGNLEDSYLGAAKFALENLDESRVYVDLVTLSEEEAKRGLEQGELAGYLYIPEDFVQGILERRSVPLRFVVKGGPSGMGSLLMIEACTVAAELTEESQRGIYGMQLYARDAGQWSDQEIWSKVDSIVLQYADSVLNRSGIVKLIPTAGPDGASFVEYYVCALLTLFALLWGVSCYGILRRRDLSLEKMLVASKGGTFTHALEEYLAYFLFSVPVFLVLCFALPALLPEGWVSVNGGELFVALLPGLLALTAMEFFVYQCFSHGVGTLLGQFVAIVFLGFLSGCFYPLWFFPVSLQTLSHWLPTGSAMAVLRQSFGGAVRWESVALCLGWCLVFLIGALAARRRALRR